MDALGCIIRWLAAAPPGARTLGVKDNIDVVGAPTSNGARVEHVAQRDAAVVARLRAAGYTPVAKTNLHEGALGTTSDNPHHGRVDNPRLPGHTPGGSSGGSAAAVAAGLVDVALGTDTMGSVRLPAAWCGIVGFKPTWNAADLQGVLPLAHAFDHVGPLARDVEAVADVLRACGAVPLPPGEAPGVLAGTRIAVLVECAEADTDPTVAAAFESASEHIAASGARVERASLGLDGFDLGAARRAGLLLVEAEAARALEAGRLGPADAYSAAFLDLLEFGRRAPAEKLSRARERADATGRALRALLAEFDFAMTPTSPRLPHASTAPAPADAADFTAIANFAGVPAVSLPAPGETVGLQLIGALDRDAELLAVARDVERCLR